MRFCIFSSNSPYGENLAYLSKNAPGYEPVQVTWTPGARILNVYGAQESIPRHQFRQPMQPGGPVR